MNKDARIAELEKKVAFLEAAQDFDHNQIIRARKELKRLHTRLQDRQECADFCDLPQVAAGTRKGKPAH